MNIIRTGLALALAVTVAACQKPEAGHVDGKRIEAAAGNSEWLSYGKDYNEQRPHSALGYETPAAFAAELNKQWPVPLRPSGAAQQAIASPAPMRNNCGQALIPAG